MPPLPKRKRRSSEGTSEKRKIKKDQVKKRKKSQFTTFNIYIFKVLQQVSPGASISKKAMNVMDNFMIDVFERLAREASNLAKINSKKTIGSKEIQTATLLVVQGELAKHAVNEGEKAIATFKVNS